MFIQEWHESDHSCVFAAELDNIVVGVCLLNIYGYDQEKGSVLWLRQLAVDPEFHNNGIGFSLSL